MPGIESKEIVHQCRSAWNKVALYTILKATLNVLSINYVFCQKDRYRIHANIKLLIP